MRVAACHVAPVLLSARETTQKCISCITEAAQNGANLVVFPETYIPAFPVWSAMLPPTLNHDFFRRMAHESIYADGDEMKTIQDAARRCEVIVSIGFSEKVRYSSATLFNSNLIIGQDGEVLVHHRKLIPTFFEKLTWSTGDGNGLRVADTKHGKIGMLICGENTNPLARYALMSQGEQIHISTWPAVWPTRVPQSQTVTNGEKRGDLANEKSSENRKLQSAPRARNYDNVAANRTRAAAHCFEAKCFGVLCAAALDDSVIEAMASASEDAGAVRSSLEQAPRAASMFLDPTGALLPAFTIDGMTSSKTEREFLQRQEGILYADMDLEDCIEGKQYHDVVGGYQRLDIFEMKVDRTRREPVVFSD